MAAVCLWPERQWGCQGHPGSLEQAHRAIQQAFCSTPPSSIPNADGKLVHVNTIGEQLPIAPLTPVLRPSSLCPLTVRSHCHGKEEEPLFLLGFQV